MNKLKLLLLVGVSVLNGVSAADIEQALIVVAPTTDEGSVLDTVVETLKSIFFDPHSEDVGGAYRFFAGQNILNAKDIDYRQWYIDGKADKDMLYGLYLALKRFLSEDGAAFAPDDLNRGFTHKNYEFLKKVFGEIDLGEER